MSEHDPNASWPPPPVVPTGWAAPPAMPAVQTAAPLPTFPHPEPRPYHLVLRTWNYRLWRPAIGIGVLLFSMFIVAPFVMLPVLALGVWAEGGDFVSKFEKAATLQTVDPAALLYLNLVLGSMVFVTWFIVRVVHRMRPRWLMSVQPRIRWKLFFACLGAAVIALGAQVVVSAFLPNGADQGMSGKVHHFTATSAAIALVVIFTTPLQAAGEEYVFRGYLMQAVGAVIGVHEGAVRRALSAGGAILITSTLFALAHGAQNFPLFFDRFMFGAIAGWLVIRTGGLESGIALHILNNFLAFGAAVTFGDLTQTLKVSDVSWWNIVNTLTQSGVYLVLVTLIARKLDVQRESRPPRREPLEPAPASVTTA